LDYARTSEAAALKDLKKLLASGDIAEFVVLSTTYCQIVGIHDSLGLN